MSRDSPARVLWKNYNPEGKDDEESSDTDQEAPEVVLTGNNTFDEHVDAVIAAGIVLRTNDEAIASGQRAARTKTKEGKRQEPFKAVSVYAKLFRGIIRHRQRLSYDTSQSID